MGGVSFLRGKIYFFWFRIKFIGYNRDGFGGCGFFLGEVNFCVYFVYVREERGYVRM